MTCCDIDDNDLIATHMMVRNDQDELVAYLRIFDLDDNSITFKSFNPTKFR